MEWLDQKYIGFLSPKLNGFSNKGNNTYNFRCPICGDSKSNKSKKRGYIYLRKGNYVYHCHNCGAHHDLSHFIRIVDNNLYREYVKEVLLEKRNGEKKVVTPEQEFANKMKTPVFIKATPLKELKKISQLPHNHKAKLYIQKRKIPTPYHAKLFYAPKFKHWVNTIIPNKFDNVEIDEARIIIPFLDENKKLFGFQGRALDNHGLRYITIIMDEEKSKIFGLDTVDKSKIHYILEGPIDSMFIENSIAMAGGSIDWNWCNENSVFVYDNEPRSKETIHKIEKVINKGFKVSMFPNSIKQKDVNEMILNDVPIEYIHTVLNDNICEGLKAIMKLTEWKH